MKQMKSEGGFTLIAVLVAMVLLSVGVLSLTRTGSAVLVAQSKVASRTTALSIARARMEEIRSRDPGTLQSEPAVQVDEAGVQISGGKYTRSVVVTPENQNLVRVKVVVEFPRSSVPIELVTLAFVPTT